MGVTIKDISKEAGVSYATVSRALNNHPEVNEDTKKRIIKIANEMGYQPNEIAQGLVKNKTKTIGLMIPDITNPFFPEVAIGVEEAASKVGYTVFLINTNWDEERELNSFKVLLRKQIDGLIIAPSSENLEHLENILNKGIKIVFLGRKLDCKGSTSIMIDNEIGMYKAVEYLINKGHKNIAFLGGQKELSMNQGRLKGYKNALKDYALEINEELIKFDNSKREGGYHLTRKLIESGLKFSAVVTVNDLLALGAIQAIKEKGLLIPSDVAIIGFDDIKLDSLPEIHLSTVSQPKYEMGRLAFESLLKQIKGESSVSTKVLLEPELIIRNTT
jgi:LacI family transcriptional regulator